MSCEHIEVIIKEEAGPDILQKINKQRRIKGQTEEQRLNLGYCLGCGTSLLRNFADYADTGKLYEQQHIYASHRQQDDKR